MAELEPHRPKEYDTRKQATDPITGGAAAILSTVTVRLARSTTSVDAYADPHTFLRPQNYYVRFLPRLHQPAHLALINFSAPPCQVGIGTIFLNPPKGIVNTATAIPKVRPAPHPSRHLLQLTCSTRHSATTGHAQQYVIVDCPLLLSFE